MIKTFFIFLILLISFSCFAQDSLFVIEKSGKWIIPHSVSKGETIFTIARNYHVPPAMLADANGINYSTNLLPGTIINVPLSTYNHVNQKPANNDERELFYRVQDRDNLFRIAQYAGVRQKQLQEWNSLTDNNVTPGETLLVGWVLYDETNIIAAPATNKKKVVNEDSVASSVTQTIASDTTVRSANSILEENTYNSQTNNGLNIITEKGKVVFYDMVGKVKTKGGSIYYAFHNTAPRGRVIKVYDPGTDKTVYAKVLGPLPQTKQYAGAIMGMSSGAKKELGVNENKTWCEISYAP